MGAAGWAAAMAGLEGCGALETVGGVGCAGLMTGGLAALEAAGLEEGLAAAFVPYLRRSASCLTRLDMR